MSGRPVAAGLVVATVLAASALAPAGVRAADDPHQCGPQSRWCIGALRKQGKRVLEIAGFDLRGRYRVCVTPPATRERCRTFPLRPNGAGAHGSSISFTRHFPHHRPGRYRVRWVYDGAQLGRVLSFSI